MAFKKITSLLTGILIAGSCWAQSFEQVLNVPLSIDGNVLEHAWIGGLNHPQFSAVDLNNDGIKDLFIFDKYSGKKLTFLNGGAVGMVDYTYAPEYESRFPSITDWALMRDYNNDGIDDLFVYGVPGVRLYTASYDASNKIQFTLLKKNLEYIVGIDTNEIYVSTIDLPGIGDVNGDGDLDILTFDILGAYINYYENLSQEIYSNSDSMIFQEVTECWGDFREGFVCNAITLGDSCGGGFTDPPKRHAGSTLLTFDIDNDGLVELLLGDVACPNLNLFHNGGTPGNAVMTSFDSTFPHPTDPVDLTEFVATFMLDVDNDGRIDLLAAPNEYVTYYTTGNVVRMEDTSSTTTMQFGQFNDSFLIEDILDLGQGSRPVFFDFDRDGDEDIVISIEFNLNKATGLTNRVVLLRNVGSISSPSYELYDDNWQGLDSFGWEDMALCFGDLDDDGDMDMIIGEASGELHYFENNGGTGVADFSIAPVKKFLGIDYGQNSVPFLFDVNGDSILDLAIGDYLGRLFYWRNIGTKSSPSLIEVSTNWGEVDVRQKGWSTGYSAPFLTRDSAGMAVLYVGSEQGYVYRYTDVDSHETFGAFTKSDSTLFFTGIRSFVSMADIYDDGNEVFLIGNYRGGVCMYRRDIVSNVEEIEKNSYRAKLIPNPAADFFTVRFEGETAVARIFDIHGKLLYNGTIEDGAMISTLDWASGLYIIRLDSDEGIAYERVVIGK